MAFRGVIYTHQLRVSIETCVQDLEIIAKAGEPEDLLNGLIFLPLLRVNTFANYEKLKEG
jgi:hypothetical protein